MTSPERVGLAVLRERFSFTAGGEVLSRLGDSKSVSAGQCQLDRGQNALLLGVTCLVL